ncbi:MAG TPA: type IV toxin-antitoxin system AbiEi family antitoxin domain-containing protein [Solirubrobacter sp.]|nr:type IV toxin-antitoxin system AbiEi family antitoxin domain-containing protein [Solirubrobacter sp.]
MPVVAVMPDTFTSATAFSRGVHPRDLYAWRDAGEIVELSRGVFRRSDAPPAAYPDLLAVSYRAPRAIVCCVSAAMVHELTDELPVWVQVAVPNGTHPPRIDHPPTRVFRFDRRTFELGLAGIEAAPGERVRAYDAARTVIDLMRLRHRLGESIAHTALNRYMTRQDARPALLLEYARELGVLGPVRQALDVVSAR